MTPRPPLFPMNRAPATALSARTTETARCLVAQLLCRTAEADWAASLSEGRSCELVTFLDGAAHQAALRGLPGMGLGEVPDREIAEALGVSHVTVARWRNALGIPSYGSKAGLRRRRWHADLGKIPDNVIAKREGLSRARVGEVRKKLGIPPAPRSTWHAYARGLAPSAGFGPGHKKSPRKKPPEPEEGP